MLHNLVCNNYFVIVHDHDIDTHVLQFPIEFVAQGIYLVYQILPKELCTGFHKDPFDLPYSNHFFIFLVSALIQSGSSLEESVYMEPKRSLADEARAENARAKQRIEQERAAAALKAQEDYVALQKEMPERARELFEKAKAEIKKTAASKEGQRTVSIIVMRWSEGRCPEADLLADYTGRLLREAGFEVKQKRSESRKTDEAPFEVYLFLEISW